MRRILILITVSFIIASCGSGNKSFKTSEDNALMQAIKKLNKNPGNTELKTALVKLYNDASKLHFDKLEIYKSLTEADRFDKIIGEYEALQKLHQVIRESDIARQAVQSKDYSADIIAAKEQGAQAYYEKAEAALLNDDRSSAREAYNDFKKANKLNPGFRDVKHKMSVAYENSIILVVINPVRNNSPFYNIGHNSRSSFTQDNFQRNLVRDLGGNQNQNSIPARFYTDYEADREGIKPDWEVDLNWVDLDIPRPRTQHYSRNVSKQIQVGSDTAGRPIFQQVSGTLTIIRSSFTARGDMEVRITELGTRRSIGYGRYNDSYNWEEEYATYRGDERALSGNDWSLINNNRNYDPRQEDIIDELYSRIYPQVKSKIYNTANW